MCFSNFLRNGLTTMFFQKFATYLHCYSLYSFTRSSIASGESERRQAQKREGSLYSRTTGRAVEQKKHQIGVQSSQRNRER